VPSLTIVLVQEIDRFNIALGIIHDSLVNLSKAIKGLVVMSEELENVFKALLSNQVPASWAKRSFLSIKPLPSYISDFQRRIDFIQQWAENGAPRSYWISGFFFPQSFLTGVLQTYARRRVLPIDSLKIDFDVFERELVQQDFFEMHTNNMSVCTYLQIRFDLYFLHRLFHRRTKSYMATCRNAPMPSSMCTESSSKQLAGI